jgi:hypothetical protein
MDLKNLILEHVWVDIYPFHLKATQENRIEISLKSNKKTKSILT